MMWAVAGACSGVGVGGCLLWCGRWRVPVVVWAVVGAYGGLGVVM